MRHTPFLLLLALLLIPFCADAQEDSGPLGPPPSALEGPPPQAVPVQAAPVMAAPVVGGAPLSATDLQMRMNALETQLRNVTGQLERSQYLNNQLQQNMQRMNADYDGRFQMMEKRLSAAEARAAAPPPPPPPAPAAAATPAPSAAIDTPPPPKEKEAVLGTLSSNPKSNEAQVIYDQGFQSMRQAKYAEAEARFREFLKNYPKHRLAENAKYWLGETYYARGKFQDAAVTFGEGFQQYPTGNKAPDYLLKLAMALGSLNKKQEACTTLGELEKRFPNASANLHSRAEQEKKRLTCT